MIKRTLALLAALALGGCNVPPAVFAQLVEDYNACGAVCVADDLVQVEAEVWIQWIGEPIVDVR